MQPPPLRRLMAKTLKVLRSAAGAFDLPSILVGVVVVGILTAGVLAAVFGVIPFTQDNAAKQDLDSVRTAEGVAKAKDAGYMNKKELVDAPYIGSSTHLAVATDAKRACYLGLSKSATGKIFYSDNKANEAKELVAGATVDCLTPAEVDTLVTEIGGYGPTGTSPSATGTTGTPSPSATGTTPTGAAALAESAWSTKVKDTNYVTDPSFENGTAGWTIPTAVTPDGRPASVLSSVTAAPGKGIDGGSAIQLVTNGTASDNMHMNYAYFALPDYPTTKYGQVNVSVQSNRVDQRSVYASIVNYSADGTYLNQGYVADTYVGGSITDYQQIHVQPSGAALPAGGKQYLMIRIQGNWSDPALDASSFYVDHVSMSENGDYFDGSTVSSAATGEATFGWAGTPNASVSNQYQPRQVAIPSVITMGQDFTVYGRGYPAGTVVDLSEYSWGAGDVTATADASGNFTATMNIPVNTDPNNGPVAGDTKIEAFTNWGEIKVRVPVTLQ